MMNVVLFEPEIPPNTGNVARLCAATRCRLHLIEPLGFRLDDRQLRRAGMDYWEQVEWRVWKHWTEFSEQLEGGSRLWFIEQRGDQRYTDVAFAAGDYLVFGRETAGLPEGLLQGRSSAWLRIPMFRREARSLNLSNCVSLVVYEALRQLGFPQETR